MKGMQRARVREIERSTVFQVINREEEYYTIIIRVERSRTGEGGGRKINTLQLRRLELRVP